MLDSAYFSLSPKIYIFRYIERGRVSLPLNDRCIQNVPFVPEPIHWIIFVHSRACCILPLYSLDSIAIKGNSQTPILAGQKSLNASFQRLIQIYNIWAIRRQAPTLIWTMRYFDYTSLSAVQNKTSLFHQMKGNWT